MDAGVRVEWLILGDFAQIVGGKLYLQGGGWDVLTVNSRFPARQNVGLAAAVSVPWDSTNRRHAIDFQVLTDDSDEVLAKIETHFEVGRPAGRPAGQRQRWQMAGNLPLTFKKAGTYAVVVRIEGEESARVHFNVVPGPMLAIKQQREGAGEP
jgi:hypothetical protein